LFLLRTGCVSVATRSCLLGPTGAYWGLLMPTVILVSIWLLVSSVLSACFCLDRHCVLKSLVISEYDRTITSASTTYFMYTCRLRATVLRVDSRRATDVLCLTYQYARLKATSQKDSQPTSRRLATEWQTMVRTDQALWPWNPVARTKRDD
jgi:hypothetical protein